MDATATVHDRLQELLDEAGPRERALVAQLAAGFAAKATGLLAQARAAAATDDRGGVALPVHTLRGAALTLGGRELAGRCESVELAALEGDGDLAAAVDSLVAAARELGVILADAAGRLLA